MRTLIFPRYFYLTTLRIYVWMYIYIYAFLYNYYIFIFVPRYSVTSILYHLLLRFFLSYYLAVSSASCTTYAPAHLIYRYTTYVWRRWNSKEAIQRKYPLICLTNRLETLFFLHINRSDEIKGKIDSKLPGTMPPYRDFFRSSLRIEFSFTVLRWACHARKECFACGWRHGNRVHDKCIADFTSLHARLHEK